MAIPDFTGKVEKDVLSLSDGTMLELVKTAGVSDNEWEETKKWLESNPEEARRYDSFNKDASAVRANLQTQAFQEYYSAKLGYGDDQVTSKLTGLERNPEFAHIFEDIRRGGAQAAMQHYYNEPLMLKISRSMGGVPEETRDYLEKVQKSPLTVQEAAKWGDLKAIQDYVAANPNADINEKDAKGVSCLGYAIGANRTAVVKFLMGKGADAKAVDTSGGTGAHYAAAYGRKELLEFLLTAGCGANDKNTAGQTPLALATKNKQAATIDFLKSNGGTV
mmetsp:Transcript_92079/g.237599  ORF Transcript_92079/g.237599 Transcript_92079/m.237599 type:complete len:277 (-) Transcript_92079:151-981(-)